MAGGQVPLTNPLAFHITDWVTGPQGRPWFMGTSSNWAFGRRVLMMTHKRLTGAPLPPDNLLFDSYVYDLKWNGNKMSAAQHNFDSSDLPTQDFAVYLINSVKFHCGRLFYLFDEELFMEKFARFHANPQVFARSFPLWYIHYLLVLAFGKALLSQNGKLPQPPGTELFVQAMKLMPDFTFHEADPLEETQVLCCAALWLQCLNCRPPAHRMIGQALRRALYEGMHTEMQNSSLDEACLQRYRTVWWTIYVLERQITSLLGVPPGIAEESISTPFPTLAGQPQKSIALRIQVKLSQILAKIDQTVYGRDGKLDTRYIGASQSVLRDIAEVTQQLESSLDLHANESMSGISRLSAHLHLLLHQSIILTTRPLLYIFLQARLGESDATTMQWLQSESVRGLMQICIESAQQILRILSLLHDEGLLETFLTFDLDATFISALALLMAAAIDSSLLFDHSPWSQRAYTLLDGMISRGNRIAEANKRELKLLEAELGKIIVFGGGVDRPGGLPVDCGPSSSETIDASSSVFPQPFRMSLSNGFDWAYELSADQLINTANSLDLNSIDWAFLNVEE